jgi:hypothetical protein
MNTTEENKVEENKEEREWHLPRKRGRNFKTVASLMAGGVALVGAAMWFAGKPSEPPDEKIVFVPVNWETFSSAKKDLLSAGDGYGDLHLLSPLVLKSIYPHSTSLSDRYPTLMRLLFEGTGVKAETNVIVRCDVIAKPNVLPGTELVLQFADVQDIASKMFSVADGERVDGTLAEIESAIKEKLSAFTLRFPDASGFTQEFLPAKIWTRADGLDCKVNEKWGAK